MVNPAARICQQVLEDGSIASDQVEQRPRKRLRLDLPHRDGARGDQELGTSDRTDGHRNDDAAYDDNDDGTTDNGNDDRTTHSENDDGTTDEAKVALIASKVVKKLTTAMKNLEKQPLVLCRQPESLHTEPWKKNEDIQQLENALWVESDRIAATAGELVHFLRLLFSCCRNYRRCNNMPVEVDEDPAQQEKKWRHETGFAVLSWIVDGLYFFWGPPALMLYWAVCSKCSRVSQGFCYSLF